jgi:titin
MMASALALLVTGAAPAVAQDRPYAPQGVSATAGVRSVTVTWLVFSDDGSRAPITDYLVTLYPKSTHVAATKHSTSGSVRFDDLTPGVAYVAHVRAINSYGAGASSTDQTAVPLGPPSRPGRPSGVITHPAQVDLTWPAPSWDGGSPVTGYEVVVDGGAPVPTGAARSTTITVRPGGVVTVRVRAKNAIAGWGLWSDELRMTGKGVPEQPTGLTTVPIASGIRLTWTNRIGQQSGGRTVRYYRAIVAHGKDNLQKTVHGDSVYFVGFGPGAELEVAVVAHTKDADGLGDLGSTPVFVPVTLPGAATPGGSSTSAAGAPSDTGSAGASSAGSATGSSTHGSPGDGAAANGARSSAAPDATPAAPGDDTTVLADAPVERTTGTGTGARQGVDNVLLIIAIAALALLLLTPASLWWRHRSRRTGESP